MNRAVAMDRLVAICEALQVDELRVLEKIASRLHMGSKQYGVLKLATDKRDMLHEANEEFLDAAVYLACRSLKAGKTP